MPDAVPLRTLAADFNSFFASCEQTERPELRGKPIGIVPVIADTTCIIAASYEAKRRGVRVETGVQEALLRCPDLILVPQRPALYIKYHHRLLEIIERCIHVSVVKSIDEVECDLTATFAPREKALKVANQIKAILTKEIGPTMGCSIGIAPNWPLAKLATDMQKPNGLVVIEESDLPHKLLHLDLQDLLGIGPCMDARLRDKGIDTVAKLCAAPKTVLHGIWGSVEGDRMWQTLRGDYIPRPIDGNKTISHSHVLPPYLRNVPKSEAVLHRLLQKAAMRLRAIDHYAGAMGFSLDYFDEPGWGDELRLTETQDTITLTHALKQLWSRRPAKLRHKAPCRVGIVLTRLVPPACHTPDLFNQRRDEERRRLQGAMDTVNHTFGNGSVYFGAAFGATQAAPMRISFTCIPKPELEEIDEARGGRLRPSAPEPQPYDEAVQEFPDYSCADYSHN
ncbi:MAG: DNA polymerase [Nitrospira sp.]|nr:DNA polymerase [Nitrospira sp.]